MKWFLFTYMKKSWDDYYPIMTKELEQAIDIKQAYEKFCKDVESQGDVQIIAVSDVTGIEFHF